jgi:hypothetical protein
MPAKNIKIRLAVGATAAAFGLGAAAPAVAFAGSAAAPAAASASLAATPALAARSGESDALDLVSFTLPAAVSAGYTLSTYRALGTASGGEVIPGDW